MGEGKVPEIWAEVVRELASGSLPPQRVEEEPPQQVVGREQLLLRTVGEHMELVLQSAQAQG